MSLDKVLYNFARKGMIPTMKGYVGSGPISMDSEGRMVKTGVGREFFVAGNWGVDTNDGSSWDKAFLTLAAAIAANNADVAADKYGWATRNKIYISADTTTEDLVAFPNKCDVIGVGSYDANVRPGITGNHVPVNAGNYGTRFINIWFKAPADASPIVTLASTTSGCQFIECTFSATATTTIGIQATASPFLKVYGCRFEGAFVTSFITFGAGESGGTEIIGNLMVDGADNGIVAPNTVTASWANIIAHNLIQCADLTIDDDGDLFLIFDNVLISGENVGANSYDFGATKSAVNYVTGADKTSIIPALA